MRLERQVGVLACVIFVCAGICKAYKRKEYNDMYDGSWGLFKPHLLFCLTQRSLHPINFGLMYQKDNKNKRRSEVRWKFGNTNDGIFADFVSHNGDDFAEEIIVDHQQSVIINVSFVKNNEAEWGVNVRATNTDENSQGLNLYLYLSSSSYEENKKNQNLRDISLAPFNEKCQLDFNIKSKSSRSLLQIEEKHVNANVPSKFDIQFVQMNPFHVWDINQILKDNIIKDGSFEQPSFSCGENSSEQRKYLFDDKRNIQNGNVALIRVTNEDKKDIELFIKFSNSTRLDKISQDKPELNVSSFDSLLLRKNQEFQSKLKKVFGSEKTDFIRSVLSNLLGGIVFYHGKIVVHNSLIRNQKARNVFATSPSRKVFPRAFLWDEGFHELVICSWSENLCKQFLHSWMSSQDVFGYISREQVRSSEISKLVPDGFHSQDALEANPPTLLLAFLRLSSQLEGNKSEDTLMFIKNQSRKLEKWLKWFMRTQSSSQLWKERNSMFDSERSLHLRWKCKRECKDGNFMGSGLDDYPRQSAGSRSKQHLDLHSWVLFFLQSMQTLSLRVGEEHKFHKYGEMRERVLEQLRCDFLDNKDKIFKDISVNEDSSQEEKYENHLGYISLFPFLFNALSSETEEFGKVLDILSDPNHLWSPYGIRSLSLQDSFYGLGDNYWRGPIWMPLNFLILRALRLYYSSHLRAHEIYVNLRNNLIQNIFNQWKLTGYIFETYNTINGKGQRGFPFNGWTSLIILVINESYT